MQKPAINPLLKIALEAGPLVLFFVVNSKFGIFAATGTFMVAVIVALAVSYWLTRHVAIMPLVSAAVVIVFGSLTIFLHDETFIKIKPTIIYGLFAAILGVGLLLNKPLLAIVFDQMFNLTAEGWKNLTLRWTLFFVVMAVVNEIVWRTQTTDFWVSFKLFAVLPATMIFAMAQFPLMQKHESKTARSDKS